MGLDPGLKVESKSSSILHLSAFWLCIQYDWLPYVQLPWFLHHSRLCPQTLSQNKTIFPYVAFAKYFVTAKWKRESYKYHTTHQGTCQMYILIQYPSPDRLCHIVNAMWLWKSCIASSWPSTLACSIMIAIFYIKGSLWGRGKLHAELSKWSLTYNLGCTVCWCYNSKYPNSIISACISKMRYYQHR